MNEEFECLFHWRYHVAFYFILVSAGLPILELLVGLPRPSCGVSSSADTTRRRIFDCFLYHSESYMLYLHLFTLSKSVDNFVIGYSNQSFTNLIYSPISFSPFEEEIMTFSDQIVFVYIDFTKVPLSESKWDNGTAWRREATARNHLIEGVKQLQPDPDDIVMLCDVDEIVTRNAILLVRKRPPVHYYNLQGLLFHYSFRWQVGEWERPLVIRFGSIQSPLDDYKFAPFLFPLPGVLHYHCSFCFPKMSDVIRKLRSFSHTEYSKGKFRDPNYVYGRIICGFGVLPPRWKMPEMLTLVEFNPKDIILPNDARFDFLMYRIGFQDIPDFAMNATVIREYMPKNCSLKHEKSLGSIGALM
jgi:hypothetical protein